MTYTREVFAPPIPNQVMVVRLTASEPGKISFRAGLVSPLRYDVRASGDTIVLTGKAPLHADPQYHPCHRKPIVYADDPAGEGMNFDCRVRALAEGGEVKASGDGLSIKHADAVTLIVSAATSFNGFDRSPGRVDPAPLARPRRTPPRPPRARSPNCSPTPCRLPDCSTASTRPGVAVPRRRTADRRRVDLPRSGPGPGRPPLPVRPLPPHRQLPARRAARQPPGHLERQGPPPLELQLHPQHQRRDELLARRVANLAETHEPLLQFIRELARSGRQTARELRRPSWFAHHNSDLWRQSAPVGNRGQGEPKWANWPIFFCRICESFWTAVWIALSQETSSSTDSWPSGPFGMIGSSKSHIGPGRR